MRTSTRLAAFVGAAALSITLAACGSDNTDSTSGMDHGSSTSSAPSASASAAVDAQHNAADVSFTQNMIVHHQGAISMAQMATTQASTQPVKDLAHRIAAAQGPEITEMTSWLEAWSEATSSSDSMPGMDHSTSSGPMGSDSMAMMTDEQMNQLQAATGTDFDRMFLQMMTTHHQGAIEMAKTEQANGSNPQAIALAKSIESSQTAEVTEMSQMLRSLG